MNGLGPEIPVKVEEGTIRLRPPLLFSAENPDGVTLARLIEQILSERRARRGRQAGTREESLVITKLEEALLWEQRRLAIAEQHETPTHF